MTRRPITPPPFDPYAFIDGDDEDPYGYSRLDRMDGLGKPLQTPDPACRAVVNIVPADPYSARRSRHTALWLGFWVALAGVAFIVGAIAVNGIPT